MQWLGENDDISLEYLRSAYERDKRDGVWNDTHVVHDILRKSLL